jgi:hypothetical protein
MKGNILKLGMILNKKKQQEINGGSRTATNANCHIYTEEQCTQCGGGHLPNGCCLGSFETHLCLTESGGIDD